MRSQYSINIKKKWMPDRGITYCGETCPGNSRKVASAQFGERKRDTAEHEVVQKVISWGLDGGRQSNVRGQLNSLCPASETGYWY
jgi:hypothetical protein